MWAELARLRRVAFASAAALFAVYGACVFLLPDEGPDWVQAVVWVLRNLYIWWMLCAILGFARTHLNRPFRWLAMSCCARCSV